jgi:hypothetical protein
VTQDEVDPAMIDLSRVSKPNKVNSIFTKYSAYRPTCGGVNRLQE